MGRRRKKTPCRPTVVHHHQGRTKKTVFTTEAQAWERVGQLQSRDVREAELLDAYRCGDVWHVGHRRRNGKAPRPTPCVECPTFSTPYEGDR